MQSKSLLIAIAAFAVTTTGASAFHSSILEQADLTDEQRSALETARELRQDGDKDAARDLLVEAGIDEEVLRSLKDAAKDARQEKRDAVQAAIEAADYDEFLTVTADNERFAVIDSEADFLQLVEAHSLRAAGDKAGAHAIMEALGFEKPEQKHGKGKRAAILSQLTEDEREALRVAKAANDRAAAQAILEGAGIDRR